MANIITKTLGSNPKDAALTNAELDNNFINLNEELITKINKNTVEYPSFTQSLHKSPNAITSMFIYDTSKDSDGGAWTDKCQNTSWYNETLSGSWLGSKLSEIDARCLGATLGADIAVNGSFAADTNWTKGTGVTISNGTAVFTNVAGNVGLTAAVAPLTTNLYYTISFTISGYVAGSVEILLGTTSILLPIVTNGTYTVSGIANSTAFVFRANGTSTYNVDNISVKPVTTLTTLANDYFQLISDGKFYSLSKNYLTTTATLATQTQFLTAGTYTISSTTASSGSVAISGNATATHTAGTPTTFTVATSGLVVFTVSGSVLTAQLELGSVATTYSINTSTTRYSETFRGNKKEFPKLSAIIAYGNTSGLYGICIYDLTEKYNPMWMNFKYVENAYLSGNTCYTNAIYSKNAVMALATVNGLKIINFINENMEVRNITSATCLYFTGTVAQRNTVKSFILSGKPPIATQSHIYDVVMDVFPNAPINLTTNLPIPTIAIANGQLSILKDNNTVITNYTNNIHWIISLIMNKNVLICVPQNNRTYYVTNPNKLTNGFTLNAIYKEHNKNYIISGNGKTSYISIPNYESPGEITHVKFNKRNDNKSINAVVGNTFNTGYQMGDIRRAYLSSNIPETITTTELLVNGSFTDDSGWTITPGYGVTIANGALNFDGISVHIHGGTIISQNINVISGKTYKIEINTSVVGTFGVTLSGITKRTDVEQYSYDKPWYITANITGSTLFYLYSLNSSIPLIGSIFSISVEEQYIEDRSYLENRATIYGTLSKTAVNSGSDLVEYSGFSNSNYIVDRYIQGLEFGSSEFNINSWIKIPINNITSGTILYKGGVSGQSIALGITDTNNISFTIYDGTITKNVTTSNSYNTGIPTKVSTSYKFGKLGIFVNGQEVATNLGLPLSPLFSKKNILNYTENFNINYWQKAGVTLTSGELAPDDSLTAWKITHSSIYGAININSLYFAINSTLPRIFSIWIKRGTGSNPLSTTIYNGVHYGVININPTNEWQRYSVNIVGPMFDFTMLQDRNSSNFGSFYFWHPQLEYGSVATDYQAVDAQYEYENAHTLTIGNSYDLTTPFPGSLSLLKISGTVPSKEQELFMYEQEKHLFNENAKCVLPDNTSVLNASYDNYTDTWKTISATNSATWNGLIRTNNIPVPSGTYSKIASTANITIAARSTTDPGVDVIIPKYNSKKKVADKDSYSKAITFPIEIIDYIGGFTGTTTLNSNVITSNNLPTYDIIETIITGTNIPANTTIIAISGTDVYISALATGTGSVNISFLEYNVPVGYITKYITKNGVYLTEGSTKDFTIDTDLFREIITLEATPNYQDWIQLQITKKQ